jgi:hypothetical protein
LDAGRYCRTPAITAASREIDRRLAIDPMSEGESRPDGTRIAFEFPLTVRFEVSPDGQVVTVLHVRQYGRSR